jgi:hypothetical protein
MKRPVRIIKREFPLSPPIYEIQVRLLGWVGPWVAPVRYTDHVYTSSHDLVSLKALIPWYTGEKKSISVVKL